MVLGNLLNIRYTVEIIAFGREISLGFIGGFKRGELVHVSIKMIRVFISILLSLLLKL